MQTSTALPTRHVTIETFANPAMARSFLLTLLLVVLLPQTCRAISATATGSFDLDEDFMAFHAPFPTTIYWAVSPPPPGHYYTAYVQAGVNSAGCYASVAGDSCFVKSGTISWHGGGFEWVRVHARFDFVADPGASVSVTASAGGTPAKPEKPRRCTSGLENRCQPESESADRGNTQVAGANLTATDYLDVPVVQEHGLTDFVWANAETSEPLPNRTPFQATYFFETTDIPFTHFVIPEALPGGDSEFEILIGEYESYPLQAGVPFVFTDYFPEGVTAFLLTGFNADEGLMSGESFPYTHGYRFVEEGATFVRHGPLSPGDYTLGGLVDEDDYEVWRAAFGHVGDHPADGNNDGIVNAADYTVWRDAITGAGEGTPPSEVGAGSGAAPGAGSLAQIPEPTAAALATAGLILCGLAIRRRR